MVSRVLAGLSLVGLLLAHEVSGQATLQVPVWLLEVSTVDPESFGYYLAMAGVPGGIEVSTRDRRSGSLRAAALDRDSLVPGEQLVSAFNAAHQSYGARLLGNAIVVQPVGSVAEFLDRVVAKPRLTTTGLMASLRILFSPLDPTLQAPGGRLASVMGPPESTGEDVVVDIGTAERTVRDALSELSVQAPGHVWLVVTSGEERPRVVRVGFIHKGMSASLLPVATRSE